MADSLAFVQDTLAVLWNSLRSVFPVILTGLIVLTIVFVIYKILTTVVYHALVKTVRRKEEVKPLMAIWRYIFLFLTVVVLVLAFSGNLAATGISIGLMSAALGWALQRPITGIAAWIMILVKKPFKIGDRVIIENIRGDITDITMFYIVLAEFGGTVGSEETSGRTILIPTALLFEKPITNYTLSNAYILDEVGVEFTYETNLAKAEKIMVNAASKFTAGVTEKTGKKPHTRVFFNPSGMRVKVHYTVKAVDRVQVMSDITREVYNRITGEKGVQFAYPHTEIVFGNKPLKTQPGK